MQRGLKYFLISLPFVIFVIAFSYVPLFGWIYAFFDYKPGLDFSNMHFVGLTNFLKLYTERDEIIRVLRNTLVMSMLNIIASPLPIAFAIFLNEIRGRRLRRLIQTTTTLPNFISWFVVYGLAFSIFSANGLFNTLLGRFNISTSGTGIMGDNNLVWLFQLALGIWKTLGWSAIIYVAAIAGIDAELYDSAKVDGANRIGSIIHITLPGLVPTYLVLLLLSISNLLSNGFDQYFVFYNPLVASKIEVLDYYVYKVGLIVNDYPYSIAIGMLKTIICVLLLFTVNSASKRLRGTTLV